METDTKELDRIISHPSICGGKPVIRGTSIRVLEILDMIFLGFGYREILNEYPNIKVLDIEACLEYASKRLHSPILDKANRELPREFASELRDADRRVS
ncbi:DUF433 domain-containing protein [Leptospira selangorensis]|uniref:DUF433 domain-containing protein n=1 Tax=Leptospira selangorensis TaxID=2484982 RepID=A0A5F2BZJ2_9LEPT|nr:DUF433 domain-containing protein [Leptospira selangorensis]TGM15880.1 DUF433 domain-containing protein [Leptospira selangorensis]TGM18171.1 DUF433 domain-containing protein [Leptospira selangorensis]